MKQSMDLEEALRKTGQPTPVNGDSPVAETKQKSSRAG